MIALQNTILEAVMDSFRSCKSSDIRQALKKQIANRARSRSHLNPLSNSCCSSLTGRILERQKDRETAEAKYRVRGEGLRGRAVSNFYKLKILDNREIGKWGNREIQHNFLKNQPIEWLKIPHFSG